MSNPIKFSQNLCSMPTFLSLNMPFSKKKNNRHYKSMEKIYSAYEKRAKNIFPFGIYEKTWKIPFYFCYIHATLDEREWKKT